MPLARHYFLPLRNTDPQTYQGISELLDYVERLAGQLNLEPHAAPQTPAQRALPAPLAASAFNVSAVDGHIQVTIVNHPDNPLPVLHEVASATAMTFDAAAGVTIYGPDSRTQWSIPDPATVKYWRLRSKFLNSGFNTPQYFGTALNLGPKAVSSGVLRAASTAARTQHAANYVTAYAEYLSSGSTLANGDTSDGTPTIDWASANVSKDGGATSLTLPRTTIRGLAAGATYVLAWDSGASLARYSTDGGSILADGNIYLGTVVTPGALNGAASSAGGGPAGVGVSSNGGRYSYT